MNSKFYGRLGTHKNIVAIRKMIAKEGGTSTEDNAAGTFVGKFQGTEIVRAINKGNDRWIILYHIDYFPKPV